MYGSRTPFGLHWPLDGQDVNTRLNWLLAANRWEAHQRSLFRNTREEEEMLLMRRPVPAQKAYAFLGMLLGLLPPVAIFFKSVSYGFEQYGSGRPFLFFLCLAMNAVCCLVGWRMGSYLGQHAETLRHTSWSKALLLYVCLGFAWGIVTGAAGGAIFFVIGAFFGAFIASLVSIPAFALFAPLHRQLARGGMIEARHLWPLACGITMIIVALILGL